MMNSMVQPSAFETRDAEILGAGVVAADADASRDFDAVEYGSGWYHDAAIVASEPAPAQRR